MIYLNTALPNDNPIVGWHSILRTQDISASSSLSSRPIINVWSPDTAMVWESNGDNPSITLANPNGVSLNYLSIIRHNLGSKDIEYRISVSADNITYTTGVAQKAVADDSVILDFFSSTTAPYIRINFYQATSGAGNRPIIGHIKLGQLLQFQRGIYVGHKPAGLVLEAETIHQKSESGQYLGPITLRTWRKTSISQANNTPAFVHTYIKPFLAHANNTAVDNGTPQGAFVFAYKPVSYPSDVLYCWSKGTIRPTNDQPNGMMGFSFDVEGIS
jgi:hypothetical protein